MFITYTGLICVQVFWFSILRISSRKDIWNKLDELIVKLLTFTVVY